MIGILLGLPVEKPLFTQTLQPTAPQPSSVCTPSEIITTSIPQNEKTVSFFGHAFCVELLLINFCVKKKRIILDSIGNQTQFGSNQKYVGYDAIGTN